MVRNGVGGDEVRLAMIGMVEGNGHPYSWSAIVNGYDSRRMGECPYPIIAEYLGKQSSDDVSIPSATVSHIWAANKQEARNVAETTYIPNVAAKPTDVLGEVDGIIIPTDDGDNHVERVKPFVEAEVPIFVDKPLATNVGDLSQFVKWDLEDRRIASTSAMRYSPAVDSIVESMESLGEIRWVTNATHKTWERYGVHALEPIVRVFGIGFETVECTTGQGTKIFTFSHKAGPTFSIAVDYEMRGGFSHLSLYGTDDSVSEKITDTFVSFRQQLLAVIEFVSSGSPPVPFGETVDLMAAIIAGRWCLERQEPVCTSEVYDYLPVKKP